MPINLEQKVNLIRRNLEMSGYTIAAKECVGISNSRFESSSCAISRGWRKRTVSAFRKRK